MSRDPNARATAQVALLGSRPFSLEGWSLQKDSLPVSRRNAFKDCPVKPRLSAPAIGEEGLLYRESLGPKTGGSIVKNLTLAPQPCWP